VATMPTRLTWRAAAAPMRPVMTARRKAAAITRPPCGRGCRRA
jgi:hypothetical protein